MLSLLNGKECPKLPLHTGVSLSLHRCVLKALTCALVRQHLPFYCMSQRLLGQLVVVYSLSFASQLASWRTEGVVYNSVS